MSIKIMNFRYYQLNLYFTSWRFLNPSLSYIHLY